MITLRRLLALSMCLCALSLPSCQKSDVDNTKEEEDSESIVYEHTCDNLVHIAGVEPTETVDGVYEHWHCSGCNKNYVDESATIEFEGSTYRPALCHQIPEDILDKCNDTMPWGDATSSETRGGEDLKSIIHYVLDIHSVVKNAKFNDDIKTGIDDITSAVSTIMANLNSIHTVIDTVQDKINDISQFTANLEYYSTVKATHDDLDWLFRLSKDAYSEMETAIGQYNSAAIDKDALCTQIKGIVEDWNTLTDGKYPVELTRDLINRFSCAKKLAAKTIPFTTILMYYVNSYRYWYDEGYYDRMQFLRVYQLTVDVSSYLASLYAKYVGNYESSYDRDEEIYILKGGSINIGKEISADSTSMVTAYGKYRCFHNSSVAITLDPNPVSGNMSQWFNDHLKDENLYFYADYECGGIASIKPPFSDIVDQFIKSFAGEDFITDEEINAIYESCSNDGKNTLTRIFAKHGMNMNPHNIEYPTLFPNRLGMRDTYSSENIWYGKGTEGGEISGLFVEMKYVKGYWDNIYTRTLSSLETGNVWMNYNHDDHNEIHKNTEYDTHWFNDLWTLWDLKWCSTVKYRSVNLDRGDAQYAVTFKHYTE